MKKTLLYIFSLLTLSLWAQDGINYQGAATDANGDELTNQIISIRASVLSASPSGNLEWEETHTTTTDQFGLFNIVIGQGTNTTNGATTNFDDMDWGSANHFLKIEMDATGGTNYAMIGTTQMMSVPYALYAKSAGIDSTMLANMIATGGGGSSSGSNQSFSVSLNGDSLFISDGNFVLVPGISSMNYTKADFSANYTTVTITNPVSFTDLSTASPIAWHWDFGDGNTSTQQHPTHTYNNVGTYTVTLISTDANVSDTLVKTNYINANLDIGGYYQGGIVFYLDGNGGGLICTLQDLPNNQWGCYNTALPGAGGFNIGDGLQNTIDIVNACSQGMAARDCYNLSLNGYSDWFLPSKLELEYMQTQMSIIDSSAVSHGGGLFLQNGNGYWSSTQESSSGAWEYDMQTMGWTNHVNKDRSKSVRPIRAF